MCLDPGLEPAGSINMVHVDELSKYDRHCAIWSFLYSKKNISQTQTVQFPQCKQLLTVHTSSFWRKEQMLRKQV